MAVTYPLIGANASVNSLGSLNMYSTFLAAMSPTSARVSIQNNAQNNTALGQFAESELPGLISGSATIGGYAGAAAYLGNVCGITSTGGTTPMYAVGVQSFDVQISTTQVHDITKYNSGVPPIYMDYRPDTIQMSATINAMVDQGTPLTPPNAYSDVLSTFVLTYGSSSSLTITGNARAMNVGATKGNKTSVQYSIGAISSLACSGGLFNGKSAIGNASNTDPLWNGGLPSVSPAGAAVFYWIGAGARSVTFQDSFWRSIRIRSNGPGSLVAAEMDLVARGVITLT